MIKSGEMLLHDYAFIILILSFIIVFVKKINIDNVLYNLIILVSFFLVAIIIKKWWLILLSLLFLNYDRRNENEK
jgi:hypothetical protein